MQAQSKSTYKMEWRGIHLHSHLQTCRETMLGEVFNTTCIVKHHLKFHFTIKTYLNLKYISMHFNKSIDKWNKS